MWQTEAALIVCVKILQDFVPAKDLNLHSRSWYDSACRIDDRPDDCRCSEIALENQLISTAVHVVRDVRKLRGQPYSHDEKDEDSWRQPDPHNCIIYWISRFLPGGTFRETALDLGQLRPPDRRRRSGGRAALRVIPRFNCLWRTGSHR
jgi:hypothetical protein